MLLVITEKMLPLDVGPTQNKEPRTGSLASDINLRSSGEDSTNQHMFSMLLDGRGRCEEKSSIPGALSRAASRAVGLLS